MKKKKQNYVSKRLQCDFVFFNNLFFVIFHFVFKLTEKNIKRKHMYLSGVYVSSNQKKKKKLRFSIASGSSSISIKYQQKKNIFLYSEDVCRARSFLLCTFPKKSLFLPNISETITDRTIVSLDDLLLDDRLHGLVSLNYEYCGATKQFQYIKI